MKRVEEILVDLKSKDFSEIRLKQFDSTRLVFVVQDEGKSINLNTLTANLIFTKPNGKIVNQSVEIDSNNNKILADLTEDCVRHYGKALIEIELLENDEVLSSFQLMCKIEKSGKSSIVSENEPTYWEKANLLLKDLEEKSKNGYFNGKTPIKGADYYTEEDRTEIVNNVKTDIDNIYEQKHTTYRVEITEEISELTEYVLPCQYIVGNDSLEIYHNNDRLICEKNEEMNANYREVGENGATSNKVIFGWTLEKGDILDITVKGVTENNE